MSQLWTLQRLKIQIFSHATWRELQLSMISPNFPFPTGELAVPSHRRPYRPSVSVASLKKERKPNLCTLLLPAHRCQLIFFSKLSMSLWLHNLAEIKKKKERRRRRTRRRRRRRRKKKKKKRRNGNRRHSLPGRSDRKLEYCP
jgi:hypothetical protein